jgi:outer membrane protein assembly factor BamD
VFICLFVLSGCAWWKGGQERGKAAPEALYQTGKDAYQSGKYKDAIESFQRLKEEYPLHQMAMLAELGIADSHFSNEEYSEAELSYNDFINLHPTNENLPYAMYQLGMCHYNQMYGIDRDQTEARKAAKEFERLIARMPNSKFAFMAESMLRKCKYNLAENEFYVGHFYYKKKNYKAALKRFEVVAKDYANLGLDYKTGYFIAETKKRLAEEATGKESRKGESAAPRSRSRSMPQY